jgi:hypothetical protein
LACHPFLESFSVDENPSVWCFDPDVAFEPVATLDLRPYGVGSIAGFDRKFLDCEPTKHLKTDLTPCSKPKEESHLERSAPLRNGTGDRMSSSVNRGCGFSSRARSPYIDRRFNWMEIVGVVGEHTASASERFWT